MEFRDRSEDRVRGLTWACVVAMTGFAVFCALQVPAAVRAGAAAILYLGACVPFASHYVRAARWALGRERPLPPPFLWRTSVFFLGPFLVPFWLKIPTPQWAFAVGLVSFGLAGQLRLSIQRLERRRSERRAPIADPR
jgi:hypothetical protein